MSKGFRMTNLFSLILLLFIINKRIYASESLANSIANKPRNLDRDDYDDDDDDDDDKKKCSIDNCDECKTIIYKRKEKQMICVKCDEGYYLSKNYQCYCPIANCDKCGKEGCLKCEDNYVLSNGLCEHRSTIANSNSNRLSIINNCEEYSNHLECAYCKRGYVLKDNKCSINGTKIALIVIACILGFALLLGIIIYLACKKKRRQNIISEVNIAIGGNVENYGTNVIVNEKDTIQKQNYVKIEKKPSFSSEIKCYQCNSEEALYSLSCGCFLCKTHIGKFESWDDKETFKKYNGNRPTCEVCGNVVNNVQKIKYECGICLELKKNLHRFTCGCNFEICLGCYEKIKASKQCPGCRKPIEGIIPIVRTVKQQSI